MRRRAGGEVQANRRGVDHLGDGVGADEAKEGKVVREEGHPREGVGFRNRTGLGDRSQLRGWREM